MSKIPFRIISLITGIFILIGCNLFADNTNKGQTMENKKRVTLLGASVGKAWNIKEYPLRIKNDDYIFESIAFYEYDKTEALEEILMRPKRKLRFTRTYVKGIFEPAPKKPDVIIIKECSAYFPGDLMSYKELMKKWVIRIREANIGVVLATVVPITRERSKTRKGQIENIRAFNDWIREYAAQERIVLLDLESVLRTDAVDRFLKDELSTDGSHLNRNAYDILDRNLADLARNTSFVYRK
jgi:hypothetical protein